MNDEQRLDRSNARTGKELALDLDKVLDGVISGAISPDRASTVAKLGNVTLRTHLGYIEHAHARGEKPAVPFFMD